jgi:hypothetical protein
MALYGIFSHIYTKYDPNCRFKCTISPYICTHRAFAWPFGLGPVARLAFSSSKEPSCNGAYLGNKSKKANPGGRCCSPEGISKHFFHCMDL